MPSRRATAARALVVATLTAAARVASAQPAAGTVVFGGDVVPHAAVLQSVATYGPASLYAPLAAVIRAADLAFVNFEGPAAPGLPTSVASTMRFNATPEFVGALAAAGFDGVSLANNHAYDLGVVGLGATLATLQAHGLRALGAAAPQQDPFAPQEFPLAGGTLCVIAATRLLNFDMALPGAAQPRLALARRDPRAEQEALLAAVRTHRARCGALLVSLHSGTEYQDLPDPADRVYFRRVAEAGADVVLGHHPHTPQPVELFATGGRQVPIFYSLGNFVSNQGGRAEAQMSFTPATWNVSLEPRAREGLLAVLRFAGDGRGGLRLAAWGYAPLWTVNSQGRAHASGTPAIAAALMPRDGGTDAFLAGRWRGLVARVGPAYVLPAADLPGGADGYRASAAALVSTAAPRP